jgi:hypothetical protein
MNHLIRLIVLTLGGLIANIVIADTLESEAKVRGINSVCSSYIGQLSENYDLDGLNITFAHPSDPSLYPSLHLSTKKYNNGTSIFSTTLSPDGEYCYVSTVHVTQMNSQNCNEITELKVAEDPTVNVSVYEDGSYSIITPKSNMYQLILINNGENSCTLTESRMMWPGR